MRTFFFAVPMILIACGGGTPPTDATSATASAATSAAPSTAPSVIASAAPSANGSDPADADPNESGTPITMAPLLNKSTAKSSFPKKAISDRECWQATMITGDAQKDFATIIGKCGTPTGSLEYAKPVIGHLHHIKDKRDTYTLKLTGGYCYRYFAVADGSIKDLDILVEKNGALVADDKTSNPVAIVEADKQWCQDEDVEYSFHIEVDGVGKGNYVFGVWARPK
jgi:hypothetical protein